LKIQSAYLVRFALAAGLLGGAGAFTGVSAFTQHGGTTMSNFVPMGHEWITRMAAIELLHPGSTRDSEDPRLGWKDNQGRAKNPDLGSAGAEVERIKAGKTDENTYGATYNFVWDAIIGERWVDIGGNNLGKSKFVHGHDCLDLVTQEPAGVQYDHYMRQPGDAGAQGGLDAAKESARRFIKHFVAAATAKQGTMKVWDGGGYSTLVSVDRNYFLLGRALHLFQDSFSPDHTVRSKDDMFEKVRQVKSYLCAHGSEQHHHHTLPRYTDGDVIWKPGSTINPSWSSYVPSNMKDEALVATEASKDVWAAFIRTMAVAPGMRAATAQREAEALAAQWLAVRDEQETLAWYRVEGHRGPTYVRSTKVEDDGGNGQSQSDCMKRDWKGKKQKEQIGLFEQGQRMCLYNMVPTWGNENEIDDALHVPYAWQWRDSRDFAQPPANWKIGEIADVNVRIANRVNGEFLHTDKHYLYNTPRGKLAEFAVPLASVLKPVSDSMVLRSVGDPGYFMNRADTAWGLVALWRSTNKGHFRFERRPDGYYNIKNLDDNMYVYMHTDKQTYLNRDGNPDNPNAQWRIEGIPEPFPMSGTYRNETTEFAFGRGADGAVLAVRYQGLADLLTLQRQDDGSYIIKKDGDFLRADPAGHRLTLERAGGSKFFLDQQQDGSYLVRGEDGLYWRIEPQPGSLVKTDASAQCPPDPCRPALSAAGIPLPDECRAQVQNSCSVATPLRLTRDLPR
jgi:hypothetical protein